MTDSDPKIEEKCGVKRKGWSATIVYYGKLWKTKKKEK